MDKTWFPKNAYDEWNKLARYEIDANTNKCLKINLDRFMSKERNRWAACFQELPCVGRLASCTLRNHILGHPWVVLVYKNSFHDNQHKTLLKNIHEKYCCCFCQVINDIQYTSWETKHGERKEEQKYELQIQKINDPRKLFYSLKILSFRDWRTTKDSLGLGHPAPQPPPPSPNYWL